METIAEKSLNLSEASEDISFEALKIGVAYLISAEIIDKDQNSTNGHKEHGQFTTRKCIPPGENYLL